MKSGDLVYKWMTPSPFTVTRDDLLSTADALFKKHGIRHLPVLDGGVLVGMLSERDMQVAQLFAGTREMKVDIVMSTEPYLVDPMTSLTEVAQEMGKRRQGVAVVVERGNVVGVFTSVDALRAVAAERA